MNWRDRAACRGQADLFLASPGANLKIREAKAICAGCPVRDECSDDWHDAYRNGGLKMPGVWGGTSEEDRRGRGRIVVHGRETAYRNGCRCLRCVEAQRVRFRERARAAASRRSVAS